MGLDTQKVLKLLGIGTLCGLFGVAVDLDHLPRILTGHYIQPVYLIKGFYDAGALNQGRPLHNLDLIIACLMLACMMTLLLQYNARTMARNVVTTARKAIAAYLPGTSQ